MLYPQINEKRELISLSGIWNFLADEAGDGEKQGYMNGLVCPDVMAVPGSINEQNSKYFQFHGKGWYERDFFIPKSFEGKRIYIRFGAVSGKTTVFADGEKIDYHEGGSLPFECDISHLKVGKSHRLTVLTDNTPDPWSLPPAMLLDGEGRVGFSSQYPAVSYDFFPHSGIHRDVWLCATEKVYIDGITVKTKIDGTVNVAVELSSDVCGSVNVQSDGVSASAKVSCGRAEATIKITSPRLWDIGKPNLYEVKVTLLADDGKTLDVYNQSYGIREVKVEGEKLMLNDRPIYLKGFGKHEDFPMYGKGFSACGWVKDFSLLKWIGANSFRTSHYPYDENVLNMADRQGILVIGETPLVGLSPRMYNDDVLLRVNKVIKEMIERDKNHPSVIMWSLANEPGAASSGDGFFSSMAKTARECDSTRPITYVGHQDPKDNSPMKYFDVVSITRYPGWYYLFGRTQDAARQLSECLDEFHNMYGKPMLLAEFGADTIAGMHAEPAQMFSEEYQCEIISALTETVHSKDYMIGEHIWAFADFKANQNYSRVLLNRKGVFTRERDPKMAAHAIKKIWEEKE
ncbi:MAG: beta-glucuronidase [Eubacteriales bacterium]|nr:beta-glucuronidase [Eubacteriales bacterium]